MLTAIWRNICDIEFRFGGTAADLLSFQPNGRKGEGGEDEGEVGVDGEGDVGGGSKSLVNGTRLEEGGECGEGGEGHQESMEEGALDLEWCFAKPRRPFIMTGQQFDR